MAERANTSWRPGPPHGEDSRRPRRWLTANRRRTALVLGGLLLLLITAAALGLSRWHASSEQDQRERFAEQAVTSAAGLRSYVEDSAPNLATNITQDLRDDGRLGADLRLWIGQIDAVWVLDGTGRVVATTPGAGRLRRGDRRIDPETTSISGLVEEPGGGTTVRFGIDLPIGGGDAEFAVVSYPAEFLERSLAGVLGRMLLTEAAHAAVVAPDGRVIAGSSEQRISEILAAESTRPSGEPVPIGDSDHLIAAASVPDAPWKAVLAAPEEQVLADRGGPTGLVAWLAVFGFGVLGFIGIALLFRLLRDAERIQHVNRELAERREQAERATKAKNDFISSMAHELRTPLAAISMFTDLMRDDAEEPPTAGQRRNLDDIAASAQHVIALLDDAMDISRVESGRLELRPERISVAALAIGVVDGLHPLAAQRGVELTLEADGSLGEVFLDPARLRQVMINFVSNALKFTAPGGRVTMQVSRQGPGSFVISVNDTGIGIPPAELSRVFTTTTMARPVRERDTNRGFGLAVVKRIVAAMGGYVGVESELGKGSTFYAVLPRVNAGRRAGIDPEEASRSGAEDIAAAPKLSTDQRFSSISSRAARRAADEG